MGAFIFQLKSSWRVTTGHSKLRKYQGKLFFLDIDLAIKFWILMNNNDILPMATWPSYLDICLYIVWKKFHSGKIMKLMS